jgi:DNA-binding NarL/FixJ family response regulator
MRSRAVKSGSTVRTWAGPCRVTVVGDTVVSEQGLTAIVARDKRYVVSGSAHTFREANKLVQQHRPDLLLIEPFMENQDGIRWIKDLAAELPRTRILIVSRQSEQTYAARALRAGASGYWMKNSSAAELMRAIEVVLSGEIYVSPLIGSRTVQRFAGLERRMRDQLDFLSDRELAIFSLIAAGQGVGEIARELGISRKTVDSHCQNIKAKLDYADAEALRRGARELLGASLRPGPEQRP